MGIPAWVLALAAPYGLSKFVAEPISDGYKAFNVIRDGIGARDDTEKQRQAEKYALDLQDLARKNRGDNGLFDPSALYNPIKRQEIAQRGIVVPDPGDNIYARKKLDEFIRRNEAEGNLYNIVNSINGGESPNASATTQFLLDGGEKSTNQMKSLMDLKKQNVDLGRLKNLQELLVATGKAGYGDSPQLNNILQGAGFGTTPDDIEKIGKTLGVIKELKDIEVGTGQGEIRKKVWGDARTGTVAGDIGAPYLPSAPKTYVTTNNFVKAYEGERGKLAAQDVNAMVQEAKAARSQLNTLGAIESLTEGIETGRLTPTGMTIAQYGKSFGIDIDPKLGAKEAATALMGQLALQARNPAGGAGMPGALSDADRNFLVNTITPSLTQSSQGREILINIHKTLAKRKLEETRLAQDYIKRNGFLDDGFYRELDSWSQQNPLFTKKPTQRRAAPGGITPAQAAAELARRKQAKGRR